jgi:hypothetical protein
VSLLAEQALHGVWLSRPLVRFDSANVVARLPSAIAPRLRIVVCGHYDTQRTGLVWILFAWLAPLLWRLPVILKPPLSLLGMVVAVEAAIGVIAFWGMSPALTIAAWCLLAVYAFFGILLGQWAVGRFVPGGGDNASGTAAVLALGEAWRREPVAGVELVLLLTGCEETVVLGAAAWVDNHRAEIHAVPTLFLNLDSLGYGPPRFLGWEVPIVGWPVAYPRTILETAKAVAAVQGLADAGPHSLPGLTDGMVFLKRGVPGLTIVGFQRRGYLPNYHRMSDTADAVDYGAAGAGVEFACALLRKLAHQPPTIPPEDGRRKYRDDSSPDGR